MINNYLIYIIFDENHFIFNIVVMNDFNLNSIIITETSYKRYTFDRSVFLLRKKYRYMSKYLSSYSSLYAPINALLSYLKHFLYLKCKGVFLLPTAYKSIINDNFNNILIIFNEVVNSIYKYYSLANNRSSLSFIVRLLQQSCILTFALKYKLRTKNKVFKRFGYLFKCFLTSNSS
jgi:Type II intron maturase